MAVLNIPFRDLARQAPDVRDELEAAIRRVLTGGRFVLGEEVEQFEREFAAFCGVGFAVGVGSGTDALTIALQALGVQPGDEVITAANTCVPTIVGIEQAGAVPVLVDAEPSSFTLDPAELGRAVTRRTRAIVPVHLYGQTADMASVLEISRAHGLKVVEDCAQAHGAEFAGQRAGSLGHAGAFSFYPTKNLGAIGDAGAITTDDHEVAERARLLRNHGDAGGFRHVVRGRNSRLDALQAAILRAKLPLLDSWNERRRAIAIHYGRALAGSTAVPPREIARRRHVYHLYVVRTPVRDHVRAVLARRGIETAVHYPVPVHRQPAYQSLQREMQLDVAEALANSVFSLPLSPELTDDEVTYVAEAVRVAADGSPPSDG